MKAPTIILQAVTGLLLLLLSIGYVVAAIDIPADANHLSLKENTLLFTDTGNKYANLSSLLADDIEFIPLADKPLGISSAHHWLKIELRNPHNQPHNWFLQLGFPSLPHLHAYWQQAGNISLITELTAESRYADRPVDDPLLFLPISLAATETKTLYFHYQSIADVPLELKVFSPANFDYYRLQENSINNLLLGFMLAFLCVIAVHWMLNHSSVYMFYVALVFCMTLIVCDMSGFNFKYLWPEHGLWSLYAPLNIMTVTYLFYLLFVREFLSLKSKNQRLYQVYTGCLLLTIPIFISILLFNTVVPLIIFGILIIPLLIFTSFWAMKQKLVSAKVFSLSIFSHVFFVNILFTAATMGFTFFPDTHITIYPKLGYALEVLFFTVALAVQNRHIRLSYTQSLKDRLAEAETLAIVEREKIQLLAETQDKQLQFATTIHDLAQPLSSVRLAVGAIPQESGQQIKQHVTNTISYAEQLLHNSIHESKADFIAKKSDITLGGVFEQAITRHKHQANAKGIGLSYFGSQRHIVIAPQSLLRILDNLLANAIRYTNTGRVFLGVRQKSGHKEIQIWDTGEGLDANTLKRLLQPFEQSGQIEVEKLGFGLGLYIVKTLCEKSGYQLSIHSQLGKGSCFSITIESN